ncbi:MAG: hypothetical protein B6243_00520 [Anaerolineaceae bacterium 4572_5.2]|nr:MAG: hypothetical protein B6243_00520 [Anaerolineaceae bacterium 4572_5.2]
MAAPLLWLVVIAGLSSANLPPALLLGLGGLGIAVWIIVIVWAAWLALRARRVPWAALTAWALLAFISPSTASVWRLKILFFIAVFILGQHSMNPPLAPQRGELYPLFSPLWGPGGGSALRRAALLVGVIYIPLTLLKFGNTNTLAMNVWALALLAGYWPITLISLAVILYLGSEGGALALLAGTLYTKWGWRGLPAALTALPALIWLKWGSSSVETRLTMLSEAWRGFSASPWFGQGVGAFNSAGFKLPHNFLADAAYSAGLLGLLMVAVGAYWLWRKRAGLSGYGAFFIALGVHSLLDNAYWGVPGLLAAFLIGGGLENNGGE